MVHSFRNYHGALDLVKRNALTPWLPWGLPVLLDMSIELLCKFVGIIALPDPQSQVDDAKVGRRLVKEGMGIWKDGR